MYLGKPSQSLSSLQRAGNKKSNGKLPESGSHRLNPFHLFKEQGTFKKVAGFVSGSLCGLNPFHLFKEQGTLRWQDGWGTIWVAKVSIPFISSKSREQPLEYWQTARGTLVSQSLSSLQRAGNFLAGPKTVMITDEVVSIPFISSKSREPRPSSRGDEDRDCCLNPFHLFKEQGTTSVVSPSENEWMPCLNPFHLFKEQGTFSLRVVLTKVAGCLNPFHLFKEQGTTSVPLRNIFPLADVSIPFISSKSREPQKGSRTSVAVKKVSQSLSSLQRAGNRQTQIRMGPRNRGLNPFHLFKEQGTMATGSS